jgi:hypothetical protein
MVGYLPMLGGPIQNLDGPGKCHDIVHNNI